MVRNAPSRWIASTRFQSAKPNSSSGATIWMPALLTSTSMRPKPRPRWPSARSTCASSVTSTPGDRLSAVAIEFRSGQMRRRHGRDRRSRAWPRRAKGASDLPADAAGRARDDRDLIFEAHLPILHARNFPVPRQECIDGRQTLRLIEQRRVPTICYRDVSRSGFSRPCAPPVAALRMIGHRPAYHQHRHALDLRVQRPEIARGRRWAREGLADFRVHVGDGDTDRILAVPRCAKSSHSSSVSPGSARPYTLFACAAAPRPKKTPAATCPRTGDAAQPGGIDLGARIVEYHRRNLGQAAVAAITMSHQRAERRTDDDHPVQGA